MLFDLHPHTTLSSCSQLQLDQILTQVGAKGLDGVCITDHDTLAVRNTISEGVQNNGLCVIFGMEYTTGTRKAMEENFRRMGFTLRKKQIIAEFGSTASIKEATKLGLGVAVISQLAVANEINNKTLCVISMQKRRWREVFILRVIKTGHFQVMWHHYKYR